MKYVKNAEILYADFDIYIDFIPYTQQFYLERYNINKQTKNQDIDILIPQFIQEVNQLESLCGQACNRLTIETVNPVAVRSYMIEQTVSDIFKRDDKIVHCSILDLTNFELADSQDIPRADKIPGQPVKWDKQRMIRLDPDKQWEDRNRIFHQQIRLEAIDKLEISSLTIQNLKSVDGLFQNCPAKYIDFGNATFSDERYIDMSYMFYQCENLEEIDLSKINQSQAIDMSSMFDRCQQLKNLKITLDTSNVKYMQTMFRNCSCQDIDIIDMDTSSCIQMYGMFESACLDGPRFRFDGWDVSKVETMQYMFKGFKGGNIDIRTLDTSNVKYFDRMFSGDDGNEGMQSNFCIGYWQIPELTEQEYMQYDIEDIEYILKQYGMYNDGDSTSIIAANLKTISATSMRGMFQNQKFKVIDIGGFDLSNLVDMHGFIEQMYHIEIFNSFNLDGQVKEAPKLTDIQNIAKNTRLTQFELGLHAPNIQTMESLIDDNKYVQCVDIQYTDTDQLMRLKNAFNCCQNLVALKLGTTRTNNIDQAGMYGAFARTNINEVWIKSGYEQFNSKIKKKFGQKVKVYS